MTYEKFKRAVNIDTDIVSKTHEILLIDSFIKKDSRGELCISIWRDSNKVLHLDKGDAMEMLKRIKSRAEKQLEDLKKEFEEI